VFRRWTKVLRVGTAWGWVINDLIFIFGWTNPLICHIKSMAYRKLNIKCHVLVAVVTYSNTTLILSQSSSALVCLVISTTLPRILLSLLPISLPYQPPVSRLVSSSSPVCTLFLVDSSVYLVPSHSVCLGRSMLNVTWWNPVFLPVFWIKWVSLCESGLHLFLLPALLHSTPWQIYGSM